MRADPVREVGETATTSRRLFLTTTGAALAGLLLPRSMSASVAPRSLDFVNTHTDETLSIVYWADGRYEAGALAAIDRILRDPFTGQVKAIDPALLDQLVDLRGELRTTSPFHVISGYRSPETNARLRAHSRGVASHSLHLEGRAIDIRLPGTALATLQRTARAMRRGGVGYYPGSDFVHLDTGGVRSW